ncbi:TIGR04255 family protein [Maribacter sp. 2307UL18-2]|uniref:TIGR04255 family protein n=1 Tax=Maribacter sp. 2307UL18-2 TaxID=3386274 RepID=UPI0039BCFA52
MSNTNYEYYDNSPIIVSILQYRYKKVEEFDSTALKEFGKELKNTYPKIKEQFTQQISINELETNVSLGERSIKGVQFFSENEKRRFTINDEKFTFEVFEKYSGWDNFVKDAFEVWDSCKDILKVEVLTGISIRFVNRINLPLDTSELTEYFTTYINSNTGTHAISNFQVKYTARDDDMSMHWNIAHSLEKPLENKLPYLFDIDVLINTDIPNESSALIEKFNLIREKKNFLFNDGITDKTKSLIK